MSGTIAALLLMPALASGEPFPTRDQNPLLAGFGLPMPLPARAPAAGSWRFDTTVNWGSSAIVQVRGSETLIVDAETLEARLAAERAISRRWSLRLELPYRSTGAGSLDGFIDSWHKFFGLPEGMRPSMPEDQFHIGYARDELVLLDLQSGLSGLGDGTFALGYHLHADDQSAVTAWLDVKLPTGDPEQLTGSGATDVTFAMSGERVLADRWSMFGQAAATWLGEGKILPEQQRDFAWSGTAGVTWNAWRGLDLKLQLDAHSAVFDSALDYFGDAGILTVGCSYRFRSGWLFDFGVSEDVVVEASPDVVFVFRLGYRQQRRPGA